MGYDRILSEWTGGTGMDTFMEKIVRKKRDTKDHLITAAIIVAAIVLSLVVMNVPILAGGGMGLFFIAGIIYLSYLLLTTRNVEYEYAVTNGDWI
jgi:hypothetical protein